MIKNFIDEVLGGGGESISLEEKELRFTINDDLWITIYSILNNLLLLNVKYQS